MGHVLHALLAVVALCETTAQTYVEAEGSPAEFAPIVSARCERGNMTVVVHTEEPFLGVVHAKDYRKDSCQMYGNGRHNTSLVIDLLVSKDSPNYCGVISNKNNEQSLALAVRVHRTLELSDDKLYLITCGKSGFRNARNQLSRVSLHFMESGRKTTELIYGHRYTLQAIISNPDDTYELKVRSCISFAPNTTEVTLLDANGCPVGNILSAFRYNRSLHFAEATLFSAFRFFNSNRVHMQCEIVLCRAKCEEVSCFGVGSVSRQPPSRAVPDINGAQLMASTSVFIVEPGAILTQALVECTEWQFPWLIGLCICLAILLLVMLIVNIFLCSSLTCTCTRTEVIEKDASEIEDYDPYKVGWSSSHYGSRLSLNKHSYASGDSGSSASDHYAIVQSRPGSRYSHHSSREPLHVGHRGPGSALSSGIYEPRL